MRSHYKNYFSDKVLKKMEYGPKVASGVNR